MDIRRRMLLSEGDDIVEIQPNNEIWYTSSDGNVVTPYKTNGFDATIISNEYNNGRGVIIFDGVVTSIGGDAFSYCDSLTSVTIPDSVKTFGTWAFYNCTSLTSVTMGNSVTSIGNYGFYNCTSLASVIIPNSVTTIGNYAFSYCKGLTSMSIPDSVTTIGNYAFRDCTSLASVIIPNSVTTIGDRAFYNCKGLTSMYCKATTPPSLSTRQVFTFHSSGLKIYVPVGSVNAYKSATNWSEYASLIVGYNF